MIEVYQTEDLLRGQHPAIAGKNDITGGMAELHVSISAAIS